MRHTHDRKTALTVFFRSRYVGPNRVVTSLGVQDCDPVVGIHV